MIETVIYKLLDTNSFRLRLNEELPKFTLISELLNHNSIPFETWFPDSDLSLEIVEMSFSIKCNFQDVYLLAFLLKNYGLERIFPSRKLNPIISIGTYLHHSYYMAFDAMAEPINIVDFLNIDPKLNTQTVVDLFFENRLPVEAIDDDVETNYEKDDYYEQHYNGYKERESYGQYAGSYAQDVEGLSDDFINNVLDGEPDAYWNID